MTEAVIPRFENKPEFISDLANFNSANTSLYIGSDVKNLERLQELNIKHLYLIGAKEKDIDKIFSVLRPEYVSLYQFLAKDLSCLEQLVDCVTLIMEWNTKATSLWEIEENVNLKKLAVHDFSKISSLDQLKAAKQIEGLSLAGGMWNKLKVDTLEPLKYLNQLNFLRLSNIRVSDESLRPLHELKELRTLELSNQFPTKEYAALAVELKNTICKMFHAVTDVKVTDSDGQLIHDIMVTGKGKPFLLKGKDDLRIEKYRREFEKLKEIYSRKGGQ